MGRPRRWIAAAMLIASISLAAVFTRAGTVLVVSHSLPETDAVVSLASHEWERLPLAAELAAKYRHAKVLLTQPPFVTQHNCFDCARRGEWLRRLGVDPARVQTLPITQPGTYGEAVAVLTLSRETPLARVVVVTSPYHTRRALATFRHVFRGTGVAIGVAPATDTSPARPALWWLARYDLRYVPYEWAARVYYAVKYGVPLRD